MVRVPGAARAAHEQLHALRSSRRRCRSPRPASRTVRRRCRRAGTSARDRQPVNARRRGIDDAPALNFVGPDRRSWASTCPFTKSTSPSRPFSSSMRPCMEHRVREVDRAVGQEPIVGEDQQPLGASLRQRIVRGADDDRANKALRDLVSRAVMQVRMVPVRARRCLAES